MMKFILASVFSVLAFLSACAVKDNDAVATPRRQAYPRIEVPDSTFRTDELLPNGLEINAVADFEITRSNAAGLWLNVAYPRLDAEIFFTFTPITPSTTVAVLDNRVERAALNAGSSEVELVDFISEEGLNCRVISSIGGSGTTPVQFIATDSATIVVSGAAYLRHLTAATRDSLRPVVAMLRRDIIHALKNIRP